MLGMRAYSAGIYGDAVADLYDVLLEPMTDRTTATVEFLAAFAPGGRALELGVGTGRVAIPLAERGIAVHGIDASPRMLDRLRRKAGDLPVTTTVGDFGGVDVPGDHDLAYVVFNTFYGLSTQDEQVQCVRRVAARLRPGGAFVVEAFVPDRARFDGRGTVTGDDTGGQRLEVARHDPVRQTLFARQVLHTDAGVRMLPVHMRYVWPAELDLMARIAGLRLVDRFGGWCREPFTADSVNHVSVYSRTSAPVA
jgi:SAM-dependent methyltransferase